MLWVQLISAQTDGSAHETVKTKETRGGGYCGYLEGRWPGAVDALPTLGV